MKKTASSRVVLSFIGALLALHQTAGQIVEYRALYSSTDSGFVSATAIIFIDESSVPSGNTPLTYNNLDSVAPPSWFQAPIKFEINVGQQYSLLSYPNATPGTDGITSMTWRNPTAGVVNPSVFLLNGYDSEDSLQLTQVSGTSLSFQVGIGPSAQTYNLTMTQFSAVPEPEEWAAIASSGLLAFALWHRRSRMTAKA